MDDQYIDYKEDYLIENAFQEFSQKLALFSDFDPGFYEESLKDAHFWGQMGYRHLQIKAYLALYEWRSDSHLAFLLAKAFRQIGEKESAWEWMQRVDLSGQTNQLEVVILRGQLALELGFYQESKQDFQHVLQDWPQDYRAYQGLAQMYDSLDQTDQKIYYLEILLTYFISEEPILRASWRKKLLEAYIASDQIDLNQIQTLVENTSLPPLTVEECALLADFYSQLSNWDQAKAYLKQGLNIDPQQCDLLLLQLEIGALEKDQQTFKSALEKILSLLPPYSPLIMDCLYYANLCQVYSQDLMKKLVDFYPLLEDSEDQFQVIVAWVAYQIEQGAIELAGQYSNFFDLSQLDPAYRAYLDGKIAFYQGRNHIAHDLLQDAWMDQVQVWDLKDLINRL